MNAHPRGPSATIVAFDGVVADTLGVRARVLEEAISVVTQRMNLPNDVGSVDARGAIPGRTFAEAARELLPSLMARSGDVLPLETLVDLVAVDAGRRYGEEISHGISLHTEAQGLLAELAVSDKVVARADSARRDVDALLSLSGLADAFTFVRCSDDAPRHPSTGSLESAWIAMDRRLLQGGIAIGNRTVLEVAEVALEAARPFAALVRRPRFQPDP